MRILILFHSKFQVFTILISFQKQFMLDFICVQKDYHLLRNQTPLSLFYHISIEQPRLWFLQEIRKKNLFQRQHRIKQPPMAQLFDLLLLKPPPIKPNFLGLVVLSKQDQQLKNLRLINYPKFSQILMVKLLIYQYHFLWLLKF